MITQIEIKRFKTIRDLTLKFSSFNLLAGLNGMGKSTCLQALLLLRQSYYGNTLPDKGLLLRGSFLNLGLGIDVLHQFESIDSVVFGISTDLGTTRWTFDVKDASGLDDEVLPLQSMQQFPCAPYDSNYDAYTLQPFNRGFRYLSADRIGPEASFVTSIYMVRELGQIGGRGEYAVHFLAEHQNSQIGSPELRHQSLKAGQNDLLSNVRAWMGAISPGVSIEASQFTGIDAASLAYDFDVGPTGGFTHQLRPANVGFGLTYTLPIIIATLASKQGDTLIVENPESHLHPAGQTHIARLLALAAQVGVQVFVETHSDHILNGLRLAVRRKDIKADQTALFWFERDCGDPMHSSRVKMPKVDSDGKLNEWPLGFFDETEKTLFELI